MADKEWVGVRVNMGIMEKVTEDVSWEWEVKSGELRVESGEWRVESRYWRVQRVDREWKVERSEHRYKKHT